ncbi:hypothetical protein [Streptomyces sp. NPDC003015]
MSTPPPTHPHLPPEDAQQLAEQAMSRIATCTDTSWARESSRVWRARGAESGTWHIKIHQNTRFHHRKVDAYRSRVPRLGAAIYDLRGTLEEDNHLLGLLRFKPGTGGQAVEYRQSRPPRTRPRHSPKAPA